MNIKYFFLLILFSLILFLGCESQEKPINFIALTKKALGEASKEGVGCKTNEDSIDTECIKENSSDIILATLNKPTTTPLREAMNRAIETLNKNRNIPLSPKLDSLITLEKEAKEINSKEIDSIKTNYIEDLENLVMDYNREENPISVKYELTQLVKEAQRDSLSENSVRDRLSALVDSASIKSREESLEKITYNLEELVTHAEKSSLLEKEFVNSVIKEVSKQNIELIVSEEDYIVIKVKKGDNLYSLAEKYYSDSSKYTIIYQANISKIEDGYTIYPDSELRIPKI